MIKIYIWYLDGIHGRTKQIWWRSLKLDKDDFLIPYACAFLITKWETHRDVGRPSKLATENCDTYNAPTLECARSQSICFHLQAGARWMIRTSTKSNNYELFFWMRGKLWMDSRERSLAVMRRCQGRSSVGEHGSNRISYFSDADLTGSLSFLGWERKVLSIGAKICPGRTAAQPNPRHREEGKVAGWLLNDGLREHY